MYKPLLCTMLFLSSLYGMERASFTTKVTEFLEEKIDHYIPSESNNVHVQNKIDLLRFKIVCGGSAIAWLFVLLGINVYCIYHEDHCDKNFASLSTISLSTPTIYCCWKWFSDIVEYRNLRKKIV
jgi:hypothetical protein